MWLCPDFDCVLSDIKPDHNFAYGWLECFWQSEIGEGLYSIDFTHIKLETI
jgi:hypothetical protein